ncbi:MAG: xanthine dehydrogenase family protein subunit M [Hyphomicrobiaceae bacterium]
MKPAPFDYYRPATLGDAVSCLAPDSGRDDVKVLAGGQTLGPMLNLRLAQPGLLVDITRLAELVGVGEEADTIRLGGCITHAAIEDRRVPDVTQGFLPHVAAGIAYRAVRSRGTLGGSLAHADPAADWLSAFRALAGELEIVSSRGSRREAIASFVTGALATTLQPEEILAAVRVRRLSPHARWGYHKICRKVGEFAEAIGAVVADPESGHAAMIAGATGGAPIDILPALDLAAAGRLPSLDETPLARIEAALAASGYDGDAYETRLHAVALRRALAEAHTR